MAKQAVKDGCDAYKKFLKGFAEIPRFKSRKKAKPSFYNDTSKLKVNSKSVLLEKIGWVKIKPNQLPTPPCKYINPRVSHDGKYWYLSVGVDQEQPCVKLTAESIGIDVGIKDLAICSNGMVFKNINKAKVMKQLEKRLRRLQRKVSNNSNKIKMERSMSKPVTL